MRDPGAVMGGPVTAPTIHARHERLARTESGAVSGRGTPAEIAREANEQLLPKQSVYVIDDDPSVRGALLRFLAMKGLAAQGFETAERFLADLPGLAPGALIVDVQLPGISGLELLSRLVRAGIDWPAVVISGSHAGHEDAVARTLGPDRYLRKPFDPDALLRALHAAGIRF